MASSCSREEKVKKIFEKFDMNRDGGLNGEEMTALVVAANPRVKFNDEQINAINDEIFRTYGEFIDGEKGLTYDGLLSTYNDGAGDVDRDLDALGLQLSSMASEASPPPPPTSSSIIAERVATWTGAAFPNDVIVFNNTWQMVDILLISINRLKAKQRKDGKLKDFNNSDVYSEPDLSRELEPLSENSEKKMVWNESGRDYTVFLKQLGALRRRVDEARSREEAFDGHMAIGRLLYEHQLVKDALVSFKRALELERTDARSRLWTGNCLCNLGRHRESKEQFSWALEIAEVGGNQWDYLLPQIHINLGIALEKMDMVSKACEHYREAVILCPKHFRGLKLLGSALFRIGEYGASEKALEEAIFLKPDYADAHCDLGLVLHATGRKEGAIQEYQKAMDLRPGHVNALYNLGGLFMDMGRCRMASEMYTRVLEVSPNNWRALFNRAVALSWVAWEGDEEVLRKAMKEAFKMSHSVESQDVVIAHIKQLQEKAINANGGSDERIRAVLDEALKTYIKYIDGQRGSLMSKCLIPSYNDDAENVNVTSVTAPQPNPEPVLTRGLKRMRAKQ